MTVQQQGLVQLSHQFGRNDHLVAAAGGLFCVRYLCYKLGVSSHFVCNPVLKIVKRLPHLEGLQFTQRMVMSTDRVSMEYEIIVVFLPNESNHPFGALIHPDSIFVYASKTGKWRQAPYKPMNPPVNYPNYRVWWGSLTIFKNQLYCIVNKGSSQGIVSYNKETGEVTDLGGVNIPWAPSSHLVVCKDKLCFIHVKNVTDIDFPSVEIFEINIAKKESNLLTEMPQDLLIWVFGHHLELQFCWNMHTLNSYIKVVTGSADSILLICTLVGRFAAYSLSKNSWYGYRDNHNLVEASIAPPYVEYYVSSCCLSLCPP